MTGRTIGGVSCARNEQENRRSRYQKCEQKRIRKMKRAVLSRPFKVILLCLAFIAVISFWSRNVTLAERNESVAFQERSMIFTVQDTMTFIHDFSLKNVFF